MIRSNQKFLNFLNILSDGFLVFLSFLFAYIVRFIYLEGDHSGLSVVYYLSTAGIAVVVQLLIFTWLGLYDSQRKERFRNLLWRLVKSNLISCATLWVILYLLKWMDVSRLTVLLFLAIETVVLGGKRCILLKILHHFRKLGYNQKHIILVGTGALAEKYLSEIQCSPELGYRVIGYISTEIDQNSFPDLTFLGTYEDLVRLLELISPDEVVVAMSPKEYTQTQRVIAACEKTGTKMAMIPFYTQFFPANPQIDYLNDIPMLHLRPNPLEHFAWSFIKRAIDFLASLFLLLLLSPVFLTTAVGVKITTRGSVIFKQIRVGKDKKEFCMYKFRSMSEGTADEEKAWTTGHDPRKTKFGAVIRKCSIDELPQLLNVLRGEMSLIGPRPELPVYVEQFKEEIPHYMVKHQVRPGMTGWAQVRGFRGDTSIPERIRHDIYYIEHWSLLFDLKILASTLFCGLINGESIDISSPTVDILSGENEILSREHRPTVQKGDTL